MNIQITSSSPEETRKIASFFIYYLQNYYPRLSNQALTISLEGDLGTGKTEFMKGIAEGLKFHHHIFSPTYLLMKSFPIPNSSFFQTLWHLDCYRLKSASELKLLGIEDILKDSHNIIFIEWGNKIKSLLPPNIIRVSLSYSPVEENSRLIKISL